MSKAITKKKETAIQTSMELDADWGAPEISSNDIAIPYVYLMQFMSDKVKDQEAKFGELRDDASNTLLGGNGTPLEMVPFYLERKWVEYDCSGNQKKYLQSYPVTPENDNLPYDDGELQRDRVYYFYCLPTNDLESAIPFVLPLRRTSATTARHIATQMYTKNRQAGKSPAAYSILIDSAKKEGDKGTYAITTYSVGRETTKEEQSTCLTWLKSVKAGTAVAGEDIESSGGKTEEKTVDMGNQKEF